MVRAGLIAALLTVLAACDRDGSPGPGAGAATSASIPHRFHPPEGWAWGVVGEAPGQRYGVGSTSRVPQAIVIIVPGYGEPAEVWFETASELIDAGHTVWILDRAGQGGSGRYVSPHDLGFIPSFDVETKGLREFVRATVKPRSDDVVIAISHADGVAVVLGAVGDGLELDGLLASSAELARAPDRLRLTAPRQSNAPPFGWRKWEQDGPDDRAMGRTHDPVRGALRQAWMSAQPELRLAGPSVGWTRAFEAASRSLAATPGRLRTPVLMINPNHPASEFCKAAGSCSEIEIPGGRSALHLESDKWRSPWLEAVNGFTDQITRRRAMAGLSGGAPTP